MNIGNWLSLEGNDLPVDFVLAEDIAPGVTCDVYLFMSDDSKDLAIINIEAGSKTPRQRVLDGTRTVEGYLAGAGTLHITRKNGSVETYPVGEHTEENFLIEIQVGDIMQWFADADSRLTAFEVCWPRYVDGRFEDLD